MRDASTQGARSALDVGEVLKKSDLRERGWTDSMIERLLPEPDMKLPNPRFRSAAPMRLYRRERVESIEATAEFAQLRDVGARRSERSRVTAARRAGDLGERARGYAPALPANLDYHRLLRRALVLYNTNHPHHDDVADLNSDGAFLARIAWNYFRHHLTDWDATWDAFSGRPGVRDAYLAAAASLTAHVCRRFPELCEAARAWLERKHVVPATVSEAAAQRPIAVAPTATAQADDGEHG